MQQSRALEVGQELMKLGAVLYFSYKKSGDDKSNKLNLAVSLDVYKAGVQLLTNAFDGSFKGQEIDVHVALLKSQHELYIPKDIALERAKAMILLKELYRSPAVFLDDGKKILLNVTRKRSINSLIRRL